MLVLFGAFLDAPARPAVAAPKPSVAKTTCPADRPDEMAALVTARLCGGPVKIAGQENEYDEGWAQPSGQVRWEHHYRPVRVHRDTAWVPVDTTLVANLDGTVSPKAAAVDLAFSGGGAGPMVAVGENGGTLRLGSPLGALPKPALDGDTATYPDVLPGVDMQLRADVDGYAQVLVVKSRQAAANPRLAKLRFPLTFTGLKVSADAHGNFTAKGKNGETAFAGNAPLMWDAPAQQGTSGSPRNGGLMKTMPAELAGGALSITPDRAMLNDPAVDYPVYIDPGVTAARSSWTFVDSGTPTTSYWNSTAAAPAGYLSSGLHSYRSYFNMDVGATPIRGRTVTAADLTITQQTGNCSAPASELLQLWSTGGTSPTTTWNSQPGWENLQSSTRGAPCNANNVQAGTVTMSALQDMQAAAAGTWTYATLALRATNETDPTSYKVFGNNPTLTITYNDYATITSTGTDPSTECATGSGRPYLNMLSPALQVRVTDPEGALVRPEIEWDTPSGTKIASDQPTPAQPSGSLFSTTARGLTEGGSYSWKARGFDSTQWGPWSSPCEFTVDTIAPSAPPTVTSTAYPAGKWSGASGTAGTFTFGAARVSDVASYDYGLDTNPPDQTVAASTLGGSASVSITPTTDGPHALYVRTSDRAGNVSATTRYDFSVGLGAMSSPEPGDITGADLPLTAIAKTATGVTYQWRRGDADTWTTIPAGDVTRATGGAVTWPFTGSGGTFAKLNWNTAKTLNDAEAGPDPLAGPLRIRALFADGTSSSGISVTFDRNLATAEPAAVGPGSVNLLTGNLTVSRADVSVNSYGSGLTVARSFNTRRPAEQDSAAMFGPGWVSGVVVDSAHFDYTRLTVTGSLVQVGLANGDTVGFAKHDATTFTPQVGSEDLKLSNNPGSNTYALGDSAGNVTTFTAVDGAAAGQYFPTSVTTPGSNQTTTLSWEKVTVAGSDQIRPTRLLAPMASGVTCAPLARGCRALTFVYATATTATGTAATGWGDYLGRVKEIDFTAWDPDLATPAMRTAAVASYAYDNTGRLRASWDPRLDWNDTAGAHHQLETYDYDTDGVLTTITPNGQQPWTLTYATLPDDAAKGRLAKVTRSALGAGTATTSVVYNVPTSGSGAPYDLSAGQTGRWGQTEPPIRATAVFPATQIPDGDQSTGRLPSSFERATITYLDAAARGVDTAEPGGNLSATWYDQYGNAVRTLTAGNRARALGAASDDTPAVEAETAGRLSSVNVYSTDGQRLLDTFEPEHYVAFRESDTVRGRTHTHNVYDQGAPATGNPFNLVTRSTTTVRFDRNGVPVDEEDTTTAISYDWTLRQPTSSTVDPGGLRLVTKTTYDAGTGLPTSQTTPAGAGSTSTPSTRKTTYYRAGTGSGYNECDDRPEWANLVCRVDPGGQPDSGAPIPATVTTYNIYNQPRTVTEKTGTTILRTTTLTYDGAGRPVTSTITATGLGTAVPATQTVFDPATGQPTRTESLNGGQVTATIVRGFDTLGRQTSYTDTDGVTSTISYDLLGRPATSNDGKATRTYTYDGGAERRGLLTAVTDSQAGTFTASYNPDGDISQESWPNGVSVNHSYDETARAEDIEYLATSGCSTDCSLYRELTGADARGMVISDSELGRGTTYDYDKAGRLTIAMTNSLTGCALHHYYFDDASDRTSMTSLQDHGDCDDYLSSITKTWTYDATSRDIDAGYTYDALGRTLTVPSADTTNRGGNTTITYHTTDLVDTITQNNHTTDYTIDVAGDRVRSWTDTSTGTVPHVNHYDNDNDNPSWIQETATSYTRPLAGIDGLAAIFDSGSNTVNFQISNLHGDVVATMQNGSPGLTSTSTTDEYGNPLNGTSNRRYGWLGDQQRAGDTPPGLVLMGVRLYNPATGRFLQTDPVAGGGANAYAYPTDPINMRDTTGKLWQWQRKIITLGVFLAVDALVKAFCNVNLVCTILLGAVAGGLEELVDEKWVSPGPICLGCIAATAVAGALGAFGGGEVLIKKFPGFSAAVGKVGAWVIGRIRSRAPVLAGIIAAFTSAIIGGINSRRKK